ncbi:hypothetical protein U1Q18_009036 [Sarracenia purpurea var. burkii]
MAEDSLTPTQNLTDGQTLVSSNQRFELGFFSPGNSNNRYLAIWFHNLLPLTVVWVANKNHPIAAASGWLTLTHDGALLLYNSSTAIVWSTNLTLAVKNPILQLLDSGNLVVRDKATGAESAADNPYIWESFDYISDTLLPGMRLGWKLKSGLNRFMTSWKSNDDPSDGEFTFSLDPPETPQLILRKKSKKQYRWGPWDGVKFSGSNELKSNPVFQPIFTSNSDEIYYTYQMLNDSVLSRFVVTQLGLVQYLTWRNGEWAMLVTLNRDYCDVYGLCGPYGNCYDGDLNCRCLKGFTPASPEDWNSIDWTGGCRRRHELNCSGGGDGFVRYTGLKLPDYSVVVVGNSGGGGGDCEAECLKKCNCMGYTSINVSGNGRQCVIWLDKLIDMRNIPDGGEELYIRMARAEIDSIADAKRKKKAVMIVIVVLCTVFGMIIFAMSGYYIYRSRKAKIKALQEAIFYIDFNKENRDNDFELPLFDLATILAATDKFSSRNKIGQGGFGPVYKGELANGQEIAVKRLLQSSGQGLQEFKNEVVLIAKLQHRNLVRLLGYCVQGEERILIYEFLPNKSLDNFIFDQTRRKQLTWKKRFNIIVGIARGLLYLHEDSRLRIIHRDLKASNILLDNEMYPKISDFGLARIFGGEQTEEKTKRVMGTYGYMSPEYAMSGQFSVKSDVFSFGVLVLEIINGNKNWGFSHHDHDLNLVGHAWKLWSENCALALIDKAIGESFSTNEVMRCIQVGLLCVQQRPEERPTMSSVVFMLSNESAVLPQPKQPGFSVESFPLKMESSSGGQTSSTSNDITITALAGRLISSLRMLHGGRGENDRSFTVSTLYKRQQEGDHYPFLGSGKSPLRSLFPASEEQVAFP